jgi:hypothetical protein
MINHVTLDGVMQAPGRADEDRRGGFAHGGWSPPFGDNESGARSLSCGRDGLPDNADDVARLSWDQLKILAVRHADELEGTGRSPASTSDS